MDSILLLDSILLVQHQQNYHSILVNTLMKIFILTCFQSYYNLEKEDPCLLKHNYETRFEPEPLALHEQRQQLSSETFSCTFKSAFQQKHVSISKKCDDFNFHFTNFPFLKSNIPSSPAYGVFFSQIIRYARACSSDECFILRAVRLCNKLFGQGFVKERLESSLRKCYG